MVRGQYAPASAHKGARALKKGETGAGEGPYLLVKLLRWSNSTWKERSGDGSDPAAVLLQQLAVAEVLRSGRTTAVQRQLRAKAMAEVVVRVWGGGGGR